MPGRNLAKPFAVAGFVLAEIYMLFTVLSPYGRETHPLPVPVPEVASLAPGAPQPLGSKITTALVCAVFFGPFGAVAGMGVGMVVSGLLGDFRHDPARPRDPADG